MPLTTSQSIAAQLELSGHCVFPDFLSPRTLKETKQDFDNLHNTGGFHRGGVGQGLAQEVHETVRSDEIYWLEEAKANPVQNEIWTKLKVLREQLNFSFHLGLTHFDGHYSKYPKDGFYKRHLDSTPANNTRVVSLIIYLNHGWKIEDGGQLRIFNDPKNKESFFDVDPIGGTLVCFMSSEFEHEVLPSQKIRSSFSGWFSSTNH
jgi:SM-20-related protein